LRLNNHNFEPEEVRTTEISIDELRSSLLDYYGTAMQESPMAAMEVASVEQASPDELVQMAYGLGWLE
jgi:hypothetical protein